MVITMLLIDTRENEKLIHKLLIKMGDAKTDPKGNAQVVFLKSVDYIIGDWGIEAKEIYDLYRSILGIGRTRTIVAQLKDLCENFENPFLVVYNTELKPWFPNGRPTARQISDERKKMLTVIKSFKLPLNRRFPNLRFMQLSTMDDFVDWLETNHRQNVISKVKSPATMTTNKPVIENDSRIKALMGCGVNRNQSVKLLDHYGTIPILLQKKTRQGDMMEVAGINRKQAKAILSLRDEFSTD